VSKNKPLILFDLDGTLTRPREQLKWHIVPVLRKLSRLADIGIVSGSPFAYIQEQGALMWNSISSLPGASVIIMPCNGTQLFVWSPKRCQFVCEYGLDFKNYLVSNDKEAIYTALIRGILELQLQFIDENQGFNKLTGNFISYRTSMLNWAPGGRDATLVERKAFAQLDKKKKIRSKLCENLRVTLDDLGLPDIEFALGGTTSIDIYPQGWDKTHALRHFPSRPTWFIGDRCEPGGNDYALWSLLARSGNSFSTSGPKETIRILEEEIIPILEKNNASS